MNLLRSNKLSSPIVRWTTGNLEGEGGPLVLGCTRGCCPGLGWSSALELQYERGGTTVSEHVHSACKDLLTGDMGREAYMAEIEIGDIYSPNAQKEKLLRGRSSWR